MQTTAGVAVVVEHVAAVALLDDFRAAVAVVSAEEQSLVAAVAGHMSAGETKEAAGGRIAVECVCTVLVDSLAQSVAVKIGASDELSVLQIDLVLLIIAVSSKLSVTENGNITFRIRIVGHSQLPDLVGSAHGNVIGGAAADALVAGLDEGVSGTVAALAGVLVEGLAHRLP